MALSCGLIGLPLVGKTTFFNLLTHAGAETSGFYSGKVTANTGHIRIPDERLIYLTEMFHPKKTIYAQVELIDIPGLARGASEGKGAGNEFLASVRDCDLLTQIVRVFEDEDTPHSEDSIDPLRDIEIINNELLFADLQLIETRLSRINSNGKKKNMEHPLEEATLLKCQAHLMDEQPLSTLTLDEDEQEATRHITFLTDKPMLICANLDENQLAAGTYPQKAELEAFCAVKGLVLLTVSAKVEEEIEELPEDEKAVFLEDLNITESGLNRMAKALYCQLGLISFLTAGEDECRAWTITAGMIAKNAAGKIHSDIERGFIRAETVAFDKLKEAGSMAVARDKGYFRLEGKEYVVADGDIINFRFNV